MSLSEMHLKWFEKRGIDAETVLKAGVYSASSTEAGVVAAPQGNVIVFPYNENGRAVSNKYRGANKRFWQQEGGKRTFWNADILDDPALESGSHALIITEGEMDALTAIDCGFQFTVSVPDGAPSVPKDKSPEDLDAIDPGDENSGKFEFLYNNRDRVKRIKRFILAVDADAPGRRLAAELVRRLSAARCLFVTYPMDAVVPVDGGARACKDLNEVLVYLGRDAVVRVLNGAKPYPVRGLYRLSEYPEQESLTTYATGFEGWSPYLRLFPGEFMVVSGIPSHGKSVFVLNLVKNLASIYRWKTAICSPEMPAVPILRDRFRRMLLGRKPNLGDAEEIAKADAFIERQFVFIDTDPTGLGENDEPFNLDWIIDRATDAVIRDGIRVLVIDPWNEIEHARQHGESMVDYISRGIRALKRFARLYGVVVIVVAHPTKEVGKDGQMRIPSLYDIEGAAHWYNKADHGIIVHRPNSESVESIVQVCKAKFEEVGRKGKLTVRFDRETSTFTPIWTEQ